MNLPKLAIFDMDGLLFDTERNMYEANTEVMAKYGYEQDFDAYLTTMGMAGDNFLNQLYAIHGGDYPALEISKESGELAHKRVLEHGPKIKEGIPELLEFFRQHGVRMCVASSTRYRTVCTYLDMAGLTDYFEFVVGGEMVTKSKPDPEVHFVCCKKAGVDPKDALVLEDSENGIHAAYNAGVPVICIVDMKRPSPKYEKMAIMVAETAFEVRRAFMSKKSLGAKQVFAPEPVLICGTWNEDGTADAMNIAWGGQISGKHLALNIGDRHKTTANLRETKAFTIALADEANLVAADYVGIDSGNDVPDKIKKSGLTVAKAEKVNAPVFEEFPITMECELVSMEEEVGGEIRVIGEVVNTTVNEDILDEKGTVDLSKANLITYDGMTHTYRHLGDIVGTAFSDGKKLK